jgi:hypothetical protein
VTYFVIENFGHGLDVRKHIMSLPPGTLFRGKNININRGGEPESAKAFVSEGNFPGTGIVGSETFGLLAAGGKLYTFGSHVYSNTDMPGGVQYQRLLHPTGGVMTGVVYATANKGKPFVIASFSTGYGVFFNGTLISDWLPVGDPGGSYANVAASFAAQINLNPLYVASSSGGAVTITGRPGAAFSVAATANNGGSVNDQTATVATLQNATGGGSEVLATGVFSFNGISPEWNGDLGQYVPRQVTSSVTVNGVEILGSNIVANDDGGAASAVANTINLYTSSPDYDAVASGNTVTLTARAGTGATPNGWGIDPSSPFGTGGTMGGGAAAAAASPQISRVTFAGTFEAADSYSITLGGTVFTSTGAATGGPPTAGQIPTCALVKNSKTYAIAGPNLFGSAIGDCTNWNSGTGSFVTDMSSETAGAENLTALAIFQGNLAVFARQTIQIRYVDPDPANNEQLQVLLNIGTMANKSVVTFGDSDVFFLSDTGIRSLKVRTATDNATLSDIGSPIDPLIIAAIRASMAAATASCGAIEPIDGRFLIQIGLITYVFSFFPDAKVAGWTTYETGLALTDMAVIGQRLYARTAGTLYLLGGDNNDQYSANPADIKIPFLGARQIATLKHFTALDVICDGAFDVLVATDPLAPDNEEVVATVNGTTLALGIDPMAGEDVTAVSLHFVGRSSKYGRLSSVALHYEPLKELAV